MIHYEQESTKERCSPNKESINKVCKIKFELECPWPEQKKIACGPLCRFTEMSPCGSFFVKRCNRPHLIFFSKNYWVLLWLNRGVSNVSQNVSLGKIYRGYMFKLFNLCSWQKWTNAYQNVIALNFWKYYCFKI